MYQPQSQEKKKSKREQDKAFTSLTNADVANSTFSGTCSQSHQNSQTQALLYVFPHII